MQAHFAAYVAGSLQPALAANHKTYYYPLLRIWKNVPSGRDLRGHLSKALILNMSRPRLRGCDLRKVKQLLAEKPDFSMLQRTQKLCGVPPSTSGPCTCGRHNSSLTALSLSCARRPAALSPVCQQPIHVITSMCTETGITPCAFYTALFIS